MTETCKTTSKHVTWAVECSNPVRKGETARRPAEEGVHWGPRQRPGPGRRPGLAHSVGVALDVHALRSGGVLVGRGRVVLALLCLGVGPRALKQLGLRCHDVIIATGPGLQRGVLERTGVRERHVPWVRALVHRVKVLRRLDLGLAAREEEDA